MKVPVLLAARKASFYCAAAQAARPRHLDAVDDPPATAPHGGVRRHR